VDALVARSAVAEAGDRRLPEDGEQMPGVMAPVCRWAGFTCEGSLVERFTSCHKPNCRCQDPEHRHGPYYQLSWKESGKTVSKLISADDAVPYQEWIANCRRLESALDEMRDLSRRAGEYTLAKDGHQYLGPIRPRQPRRSASSVEGTPGPPQPGDIRSSWRYPRGLPTSAGHVHPQNPVIPGTFDSSRSSHTRWICAPSVLTNGLNVLTVIRSGRTSY
jgi:hypothetical protein